MKSSTTTDLALGIPGRIVNSNTNAGAVNFYKGAGLGLWRSMDESTHRGP